MPAYQIMSPDAPVLRATLQVLKTTGPMTYADLAETMGVKLKTIKLRLHVMQTHGMVGHRQISGTRRNEWFAVGYGDEAPNAIVQASSVWEYAQRCAA